MEGDIEGGRDNSKVQEISQYSKLLLSSLHGIYIPDAEYCSTGIRCTFEFPGRVNLSGPSLYWTARTLGLIKQAINRTSRCNKVDAVRLYASYRLSLPLLKRQRCVIEWSSFWDQNFVLGIERPHVEKCHNVMSYLGLLMFLVWKGVADFAWTDPKGVESLP